LNQLSQLISIEGTKKDKAQISMGTAFLRGRDDIVDYDSDNVAAAGKKCRRDSDATKKRLKSCGMAVQTPSPTSNGGGINTRKSRSNRDSDDEWNNPPSGTFWLLFPLHSTIQYSLIDVCNCRQVETHRKAEAKHAWVVPFYCRSAKNQKSFQA
jgi:hypothetical protein